MSLLHSNDPNDQKRDSPIEWIKSLWIPVIGFVGAATAVIQFIQLWRGDREIATWVVAVLGFLALVAALLYTSFGTTVSPDQLWLAKPPRRPRYPKLYKLARLAMGLILIIAFVSGWLLYQQDLSTRSKVVILVANFDGPDVQGYRVTDQILSQLRQSLSTYSDTLIRPLGESITEQEGSEKAQTLGKRYRADLVIWGWYGVTDSDVLLTLHVENLSAVKQSSLSTSRTYGLQTPAAELKSFRLQLYLSRQITALALFVSGLVHYEADDYSGAISRFDSSLSTGEWPENSLDKAIIYFYRGNSHLWYFASISHSQAAISANIDQLSQGIADFSRVIQFNPELAEAYYNRGVSYNLLALSESMNEEFVSSVTKESYEKAIADFSQSLQIEASSGSYMSRGMVYVELGMYQDAINDFSEGMKIDPSFAPLYQDRGTIYWILGENQKALSDFNEAIIYDPGFSLSYVGRGDVYEALGEHQKAINDFNKAIQLDSSDVSTYVRRANVYKKLGNYQQAVADYSYAIQIDANIPSHYYYDRAVAYLEQGKYREAIDDLAQIIQITDLQPEAYYKRGLAYQALGSAKEAQEDFSQAEKLYLSRGLADYFSYNYKDAIDNLSQFIQINSLGHAYSIWLAEAYYVRGLSNAFLGHSQEAITDFNKVLEISTDLDLRKNAEDALKKWSEKP